MCIYEICMYVCIYSMYVCNMYVLLYIYCVYLPYTYISMYVCGLHLTRVLCVGPIPVAHSHLNADLEHIVFLVRAEMINDYWCS